MNRIGRTALICLLLATAVGSALAEYVNFEVSHVHPIDLTPSGARLLAVNTPDARLEVFSVLSGGALSLDASIPVGLEPVSVVARSETEAWVVNHLSDSVNVVDLTSGETIRTLSPGDEPTDVAFANNRAFVTVAGADAVAVYEISNLDLDPVLVPIFSRKPRAVAASNDGTRIYVVPLFSGNQTTVVSAHTLWGLGTPLVPGRLAGLGLNDVECAATPSTYPPLPSGIARNPALLQPPDGVPRVSLIVRWNEANGRFEDETGADWNACLPFRLPDSDLFVIDTTSLALTAVPHLGTTLFDVAVHPTNDKIYVPNTEARNHVRFEHPLGVQGHMVDNRLSIVDPASGNAVTVLDLNTHIDRASDPSANLAEREASISQPGMMVWKSDGSTAYLTGIGSRKLFRVDGACLSGSCVFGAARATPEAVDVGGGPTGVALYEDQNESWLYVLNRFDNSIAIVDPASLTKIDEIALHDPSPTNVKAGRPLLYDSIIGSGHGDAACSSCHIFGDRDNIGWDLGDPTGDFAPYSLPDDNVRFILAGPGFAGFDPQKGPMTTQTLRGMLEPLHWRGDRATMNAFNKAFPGLMGTADVGPINGEPAGLSAEEMEAFRQFALGIAYPPNPLRLLDDSLPNSDIAVPGTPFAGNPSLGETIFDNANTDGGQPCVTCHTHPFGAAGGALGGVEPQEPTSPDAAGLFNGLADQSFHSDLKVAHLRNMYEKTGPAFGDHLSTPPLARSGFGYAHDGAVPDLGTFFANSIFSFASPAFGTDVDQIRHVSAFTAHFPTGSKPAIGWQETRPAGGSAPGAGEDLTTVIGLGDLALPDRHCELTASARVGGRVRSYHLSGGLWIPDVSSDPPLSTEGLLGGAGGPVSFLCATIGSGLRLGGDRDEDAVRDGDDCAAVDPQTWGSASEVAGVAVSRSPATTLSWNDGSGGSGPSLGYDVLGASLADLRSGGPATVTDCVASNLGTPSFTDSSGDPPAGEGRVYLVRGANPCGIGSAGPGREPLTGTVCAP